MNGIARFRFFGGKGGVGKTTCSAAHAVRETERGLHILVVSTDPAHSLGDALAQKLGPAPRRVPTRRGRLEAVELDADRALSRWLDARRSTLAAIAGRGTYLDDEDLHRLLRLSLPGVDELIGLLELRRLASRAPYHEVVVDTAPTGHTLRLLQMPETLRRIAQVFDDMQAKHRFLAESLGGRYRPDASDRLLDEIDQDGAELRELLSDPSRAAFSWVLLPEELSIEESRDGLASLREMQVPIAEVIVNRVTPAPSGPCELCDGRRVQEAHALRGVPGLAKGAPIRFVEALDAEPRGVAKLRRVRLEDEGEFPLPPGLRALGEAEEGQGEGALTLHRRRNVHAHRAKAGHGAGEHRLLSTHARARASDPPPLPGGEGTPPRQRGERWLDRIAPTGVRLLLFGGKGGVGKTTSAATAALELAAHRKCRVLLLSTDPAHSLGDALDTKVGDTARQLGARGPWVRELDAPAAFAAQRTRYQEAVDEVFDRLRRGAMEASFDRAIVQDLIDLAPPGIDELFAVLAVIEALFPTKGPAFDTVVLDTAPTGHTLRLLALPGAALEWVHALLAILLKYREVIGLGEVATDLLQLSRELRQLSELLRDPKQTQFVAVTRAAELPLAETSRLIKHLGGLHLPVGPVLVNALTPPGCRRCVRQASTEAKELVRWRRLAPARRLAMIRAPAIAPEPRGAAALRRWGQTWRIDE